MNKLKKSIKAAREFTNKQETDSYVKMVRSAVTVENDSLIGYKLSSDMVEGMSDKEAYDFVANLLEQLKNK